MARSGVKRRVKIIPGFSNMSTQSNQHQLCFKVLLELTQGKMFKLLTTFFGMWKHFDPQLVLK